MTEYAIDPDQLKNRLQISVIRLGKGIESEKFSEYRNNLLSSMDTILKECKDDEFIVEDHVEEKPVEPVKVQKPRSIVREYLILTLMPHLKIEIDHTSSITVCLKKLRDHIKGIRIKVGNLKREVISLKEENQVLRDSIKDVFNSNKYFIEYKKLLIQIRDKHKAALKVSLNDKNIEELFRSLPTSYSSFMFIEGLGEITYNFVGKDIIELNKFYIELMEVEDPSPVKHLSKTNFNILMDHLVLIRSDAQKEAGYDTPYKICNNIVLAGMAHHLPQTKEEFIKLKGVGPRNQRWYSHFSGLMQKYLTKVEQDVLVLT